MFGQFLTLSSELPLCCVPLPLGRWTSSTLLVSTWLTPLLSLEGCFHSPSNSQFHFRALLLWAPFAWQLLPACSMCLQNVSRLPILANFGFCSYFHQTQANISVTWSYPVLEMAPGVSGSAMFIFFCSLVHFTDFTDGCFYNLPQYAAGFLARLLLKDNSVLNGYTDQCGMGGSGVLKALKLKQAFLDDLLHKEAFALLKLENHIILYQWSPRKKN